MSVASVRIEVSPGELVDKITILEIKLARLSDAGALANVRREHEMLAAERDKALSVSADLDRLTAELRSANEALWVIEDDIRERERAKDFGARFVELARAVYRNNDRRAALKREINELLGSAIIEEKSYSKY